MRLTTVILIASLMQVSASTFGQRITLNQPNVPLKVVLKEIRKQSGYDIFYDNKIIPSSQKVSVAVTNATLEEALTIVFKGLALKYDIDGKTVSITRKEEPSFLDKFIARFQAIDIRGKIVDENSQPLIGASVKIKGTDRATRSNEQGEFSFANVEENAVLVISYLGYQDQEVKASKELGTVTLVISTGKLEEVAIVSTGYQTLSKERATGSFTTVNNELYNQQVGPDVLSRLEYITNGVSVFRNNASRTSQFMVRGLSTINGPSRPLIVLDNFPYEGDINNLNPNDVESVTVLKDAAASSIWGTRAGNGVIVITTKKGKYNAPLKIEFNSNVTIGSKPDLNYLTPISSNDFIEFEQFLYGKGFYNSQLNSSLRPVVSPVVDLLARASKGEISQEQANQQIDALKGLDVRDDFSKYMYQNSINQQYSVNLRGGNDKLAYIFSTGYDKNVSNLSADFNKLNFRSEASFKPIKNLQLNTGLTYTQSNSKTGKPGYGFAGPYQMLADANGNGLPLYQTFSHAFKDSQAQKGQLLDWNYYPLTDYAHDYTETNTQDFLGNFGAQYQIIKGLNADIKYQYERQQIKEADLRDKQSYFARNLINTYTQADGDNYTFAVPKGGILDQQFATLNSHSLRGQLNFQRDFGKHSVSILTGEELRVIKRESNSHRTYGYDDQILTSVAPNYVTTYKNYVTNRDVFVPYLNYFSGTLNRFISFYANGAYTYDAKYTISGSVRRDASNIFGVATNDKWTPLWSTGLSWDIAKENFYNFSMVPYLKLRATYGYSGNVDPSKSAVTTISYVPNNNPYTQTPYSNIANFYNPDLRWEKVKTLNLGIDFKSKGSRVYGSIDYYVKNATDLYATVPVDYTVGLGRATVTKNAASMRGKGLDVELNSLNVDGEIKWTSNLNFNYYKDKVVDYYLASNDGYNYVGDNRYPIAGRPVWGLYSYGWAGLDALGNPQGYLNGSVSKNYSSINGSGTQIDNLVYNGTRIPVFYGSFGNTISFKSFSISARLTYGFGNYFRRQSTIYSSLANGPVSGYSDYAERWQKPGDELITTIPSLVYPMVSARDYFYRAAEVLIEKADVIRLQYVSFNYNLTKKQYPWLPFDGLNFYVNTNNLGIIWRANKFGIDPEHTFTNTSLPNPKSISFGLRANL